MSPTAAASPRLLPRTPTFALPVLYPQLLCSSFLAPCLCFLFLGYLSLYLSLSSLLFTHRPLRLPPPDAIYFDSRVGGRGAMGCGATSKSEKARMATRLKPLLRWRASQPARESISMLGSTGMRVTGTTRRFPLRLNPVHPLVFFFPGRDDLWFVPYCKSSVRGRLFLI
jgi:hypothetical protein